MILGYCRLKCSATRSTAISAPPVMLLYRPMVLPSRLARRGAGGTLKSTRSAAGDMICTCMPFFLLSDDGHGRHLMRLDGWQDLFAKPLQVLQKHLVRH